MRGNESYATQPLAMGKDSYKVVPSYVLVYFHLHKQMRRAVHKG